MPFWICCMIYVNFQQYPGFAEWMNWPLSSKKSAITVIECITTPSRIRPDTGACEIDRIRPSNDWLHAYQRCVLFNHSDYASDYNISHLNIQKVDFCRTLFCWLLTTPRKHTDLDLWTQPEQTRPGWLRLGQPACWEPEPVARGYGLTNQGRPLWPLPLLHSPVVFLEGPDVLL